VLFEVSDATKIVLLVPEEGVNTWAFTSKQTRIVREWEFSRFQMRDINRTLVEIINYDPSDNYFRELFRTVINSFHD
jgi:hypothetical protein